MRLLIVGVKWPPETFIQLKIKGLLSYGVQVKVAVSIPRAQMINYPIPDDTVLRLPHWEDPDFLTVIRLMQRAIGLGVSSPDRFRTLFNTLRNDHDSFRERYSRLRSFLPVAGETPDVVHFEWNSAAISYLPLFSVWNRPVVISCRGRQINVRPHLPGMTEYTMALAETFQRAAAVHCVSEAIKQEAMQYGLDPAKAWVIRPAVDPQFFHPPAAKSNQPILRVISTGSLIWRKGYEYALMAIRTLVDQGAPVQYQIIGDGPERQRIVFTIDDLQLQNHVHLLGKLSPEQVREHLQESDVFLLSSLSEGISNAVLEAMSCGLPVVTTDCGGMKEAVTDGVEGFVVPVREPEAIANRLRIIWEDRERRLEMGAAARQRIVREFSLDRQIREFLNMYQSVISECSSIWRPASF